MKGWKNNLARTPDGIIFHGRCPIKVYSPFSFHKDPQHCPVVKEWRIKGLIIYLSVSSPRQIFGIEGWLLGIIICKPYISIPYRTVYQRWVSGCFFQPAASRILGPLKVASWLDEDACRKETLKVGGLARSFLESAGGLFVWRSAWKRDPGPGVVLSWFSVFPVTPLPHLLIEGVWKMEGVQL